MARLKNTINKMYHWETKKISVDFIKHPIWTEMSFNYSLGIYKFVRFAIGNYVLFISGA